jgi:hypothetical protein
MSADMNIDHGDNSRIPGIVDFSARAAPSGEAEALEVEAFGVSVTACGGCGDAVADGGTTGAAGAAGATAGVGGAATPAGCCANAVDASEITTSAVINLRMVLNITAPSPDRVRACAYAG